MCQVFRDLPPEIRVAQSSVVPGKLLGSGGFGSVYQGHLSTVRATEGKPLNVAVKTFDQTLRNQALPDTDVCQMASLLYNTVRAEVVATLSLNHPNALPLSGLCIRPDVMMLSPLAPRGDLHDVLDQYKAANCLIGPHALRETLIQVAKGMEHIHEQNIIHQDLRVDNVLVWAFPLPGEGDAKEINVKVSDYGISRVVSSFGLKPGWPVGNDHYMAPEIVQYCGKEAYSKKVLESELRLLSHFLQGLFVRSTSSPTVFSSTKCLRYECLFGAIASASVGNT